MRKSVASLVHSIKTKSNATIANLTYTHLKICVALNKDKGHRPAKGDVPFVVYYERFTKNSANLQPRADTASRHAGAAG